MTANQNIKFDDAQTQSKLTMYLTTGAILIGQIIMACTLNFFSTSLQEFSLIYDTSFEQISKLFPISFAAACVGALSCNFIFKFINRQLATIFCLTGLSVTLILCPMCPSLPALFINIAVLGYFSGIYDTVHMVWMIEMWQGGAGPFIQAQHFCYALGTTLPPLITAPFLSDRRNSTATIANNQNNESPSSIHIPYTIGAALVTTSLIVQVFLFTYFRYAKPPPEEGNIDNASDKAEQKWARIHFIGVTSLFLGVYCGLEVGSMQFLPTFAQNSGLSMSESEAARVLSGMTGGFAAGRLLGIFLILKIPPAFMLLGNGVLILGGNTILFLWAGESSGMMWVGCVTFGLGCSTVYASFCAWMEERLHFTDGVGSTFIVVMGICTSIYPLVVGTWIERHGEVVMYANYVSIFVCAVLFSGAVWVTRGNKNKL